MADKSIDFDTILMGPDGRPCQEPEYNEFGQIVKLVPLSLKAYCYLGLSRPQPEEKLSADKSLKLAALSFKIMQGGTQKLTEEQIDLIVSRADPALPIVFFAAIKLLDPDRIDKLLAE